MLRLQLPEELVQKIEDFLIDPARERALKTYTKSSRCWQLKRDIVNDHFTHWEQHGLYHGIYKPGVSQAGSESEKCTDKACLFRQDMNAETAVKVRKRVLRSVQCYWDAAHDPNIDLWSYMAASENSDGIFNKHRALLKQRFGLEIWTSHVRLREPRKPRWFSDGIIGRNKTVPYLVLPDDESPLQNSVSFKWQPEMVNRGSGHGISVNTGAGPTDRSLRRFPRALNLLDLGVSIDPTQRWATASHASSRPRVAHPEAEPSHPQGYDEDASDEEDSDADPNPYSYSVMSETESSGDADAGDDPAARWPKLTVLARCGES
jgi:hypothetical protein